MMFLDCPAYLDEEGALRCGLPAEVRRQFTMRSSDGPLEGRHDQVPVRPLGQRANRIPRTRTRAKHDPGNAEAASSASRDRLKRTHGGPDGGGGHVIQESTGAAEQAPSPCVTVSAGAADLPSVIGLLIWPRACPGIGWPGCRRPTRSGRLGSAQRGTTPSVRCSGTGG